MKASVRKRIAEIFSNHKELIDNRKRFYDSLKLKEADYIQLNNQFIIGNKVCYELFSDILNKWSSTNTKEFATVNKLCDILIQEQFLAVAEELQDVFSTDNKEQVPDNLETEDELEQIEPLLKYNHCSAIIMLTSFIVIGIVFGFGQLFSAASNDFVSFKNQRVKTVKEQQIEKVLDGSKQIFKFGEYSNKVYFSEEISMSWIQARDFCWKNDLQLVTVDSTAELNYFKDNVKPGFRFWTSGYSTEKFTWGEGGRPVALPITLSRHNCLLLTNTGLYADPCDADELLGYTYYPLCQLIAQVY